MLFDLELQGQRVLLGAEVEVARHVAMQQRAGGHHLAVQMRALREQAVEEAAVPIGPVHHRRYAETPWVKLLTHKH